MGHGDRTQLGIRCGRALAGAIALIAGLGGTAAHTEEGICDASSLEIVGGFGAASFKVAVADDPHERAQGLMNVPQMARFAGMLFVYDTPQPVAFWMKNTLIPLDMIFADQAGRITHVHPNAVPGDLTSIPGGDSVQYVLEVNGGMTARLGIEPGDHMRHAAIGPDARWPCSE